ncbi:MAG: HAD-IC family P-type ATPase, partial [Cetobacterium sp.]
LNDNKFYKKNLKEIYKIFDSSETGLTSYKVKNWIHRGAKNLLTKAPEKTFLSRVLVAISEPMVKVLIIAIFLTIIINIMSIEQHQTPDWGQTIGITFSVLLATLVTVFMEKRSQDAFLALKEIGDKRNIKVMREGIIYEIPIEDIFPGDIIFISTGDKIPADGRIIENNDLEIDESLLTGESQASRKIQEPLQGDNYSLGERLNMVYSGTFVVSGHAKILVTAIGDNTEIGKISTSVQIEYNILTPLQKELGNLGKKIAIAGIGIAIIVFCLKIFNYYIDSQLNLPNIAQAITICIVLIVSTIPEGLPTMIAATLALGAIRLSKENALVKKLAVCESIGAIDVICSDKTGTLTENKMSVIKIENLNEDMLVKNIFFNNSSAFSQDKNSTKKFIGNPTEIALLNYYSNLKEKFIIKEEKLLFQYP